MATRLSLRHLSSRASTSRPLLIRHLTSSAGTSAPPPPERPSTHGVPGSARERLYNEAFQLATSDIFGTAKARKAQDGNRAGEGTREGELLGPAGELDGTRREFQRRQSSSNWSNDASSLSSLPPLPPSDSLPSSSSTTSSSPPPNTNPFQLAPSPFSHVESPLLSFLTNLLMRSGKKEQARRVLLDALLHLRLLTHSPPLPLLKLALSIASPSISTRSRRAGAKTVVWPVPLNERQRVHAAWRWIVLASRTRRFKGGGGLGELNQGKRIAQEVMAVLSGESGVIKKKTEVHKLGMVNRQNAIRRPA